MKTDAQRHEGGIGASTKRKAGFRSSSSKLRTSATRASKQRLKTTGKTDAELCRQPLSCHSLPFVQQIQTVGTSLQKTSFENSSIVPGRSSISCEKLKLQLFPIDEITRKSLEKDNYNPYLELTLGTRKRISSVVKHLNTKWGRSKPASGELMLFPYDRCMENLIVQLIWPQGSNVSAADVYNALGRPAIFRLRYGWFSNANIDLKNCGTALTVPQFLDNSQSKQDERRIISDGKGDPCLMSLQGNGPLPPLSSFNQHEGKVVESGVSATKTVDKDNLGVGSSAALPWQDCLSSVSVGALLSEAAAIADANCGHPLPVQNNTGVQHLQISCDSFDAAIAAHIARYGVANRPPNQPPQSSIWEADETCHAFPFKKGAASQDSAGFCTEAPFTTCNQNVAPDSAGHSNMVATHVQERGGECGIPGSSLQLQTNTVASLDVKADVQPTGASTASSKEAQYADGNDLGKMDWSWPESSCPWLYNSNSLKQMPNGGDSLSISNLLATSLDAFQNCSIF